jgi:hypothetical protein
MANGKSDPNGTGTGQWQNPIGNDGLPNDQGASFIPPSDSQIPYTADAMGKPSLTNPGGHGMPGHQLNAAPMEVYAQSYANWQASQAAAQAKGAAQLRRDLGPPPGRVTFTPAKKGK